MSHFTEATAYQWGTMMPEGRAVVGTQRLAVHLVGDQDLRGRVGGVGERQGADERQVVLVGVREHGVEVVGAVVGALEAHVDAVCRWDAPAASTSWSSAPFQRAVETA